jgi:hypothetical protein
LNPFIEGNIMKLGLRLGSVLLILLGNASCTTRASVAEVVPPSETLSIANRHTGSVSVQVIGGDELLVSSATFAKALVEAINRSRVFLSASNASSSTDYALLVIINSARPDFLAFNNYISTKWILKDSEGNEVWSDIVDGNGHSSAFAGVTRARRSAEGAARAAIEAGVSELGSLTLPKEAVAPTAKGKGDIASP